MRSAVIGAIVWLLVGATAASGKELLGCGVTLDNYLLSRPGPEDQLFGWYMSAFRTEFKKLLGDGTRCDSLVLAADVFVILPKDGKVARITVDRNLRGQQPSLIETVPLAGNETEMAERAKVTAKKVYARIVGLFQTSI